MIDHDTFRATGITVYMKNGGKLERLSTSTKSFSDKMALTTERREIRWIDSRRWRFRPSPCSLPSD